MLPALEVDVIDDVEAVFLLPEIQCPICDFYEVEEESNNYCCARCGTEWKVSSVDE